MYIPLYTTTIIRVKRSISLFFSFLFLFHPSPFSPRAVWEIRHLSNRFIHSTLLFFIDDMPPTLRAFKGEKIHASKHLLIVHTVRLKDFLVRYLQTTLYLLIRATFFRREKKSWGWWVGSTMVFFTISSFQMDNKEHGQRESGAKWRESFVLFFFSYQQRRERGGTITIKKRRNSLSILLSRLMPTNLLLSLIKKEQKNKKEREKGEGGKKERK